jgi:glycerol dehydrogenase
MGDAYATYYEARACMRSGALNSNNGSSTIAAFVLAEECRRILLKDGQRALLACRNHFVTPALENIIEANVLLSGIGFESVGLAAAHGIDGAFTLLEETHSYMHGEKVAIGTLIQLIMENAPDEELITTLKFYKSIGLPTSLAQIGITEVSPARFKDLAQRMADYTESPIHNMPFKVTADIIYNSIMYVNCLDKLIE